MVREGAFESCLLSIVIPTYESDSGLTRILNFIDRNLPDFKFEIVVTDDSNSSVVRDSIVQLKLAVRDYIRYIAGPRRGAPVNWNHGISAARGQYVWLLHHDEIPICYDFFDGLRLQLNGINDLVVLNQYVTVRDKYCQHNPSRLTEFLLTRVRTSLLLNNFIGPPSALVFRNRYVDNICYSESLEWFVDTEYYTRLLSSHPVVKFSRSSRIASVTNDSSITNQIGKRLSNVKSREISILTDLYSLSFSQVLKIRCLSFCWKLWRTFWKVLRKFQCLQQ